MTELPSKNDGKVWARVGKDGRYVLADFVQFNMMHNEYRDTTTGELVHRIPPMALGTVPDPENRPPPAPPQPRATSASPDVGERVAEKVDVEFQRAVEDAGAPPQPPINMAAILGAKPIGPDATATAKSGEPVNKEALGTFGADSGISSGLTPEAAREQYQQIGMAMISDLTRVFAMAGRSRELSLALTKLEEARFWFGQHFEGFKQAGG